jgi:hypothetical protein
MKTTINFLGIIAIVAIIGFSMAACQEEEDDSGIDSYELSVQVVDNTFGNTDQVTGTVKVAFMNSEGISENNLSWLTKDSFSLNITGTGNRTVTIDSISKSQYNSGRVDVTLNLTRSAVPDYGIGGLSSDSRTATVSVTNGGGYTIKMSSNAYFTF